MNYTQPILRTVANQPEHRYLQKIQAIGEDLSKFNFRSKFYELTESNVFTFDIQKIITDTNNKIIGRLCQHFYQFLAIRMVLRIFEQNNPNLDQIKDEQLQKSREHKKSFCRTNSIQSELDLKQNRRNIKNRANTTVNISDSILEQNINTKSRKTMINQYTTKQNLTSKSRSAIEDEQEDNRIVEHNKIAKLLLNTNENIKQAYYQLTESYQNRTRVQKLEIVSFLIALLSPQILHVLVETIENQFKKKHQYIKTDTSQASEQLEYPIQQEIYIILTYQTLGNFVSSSVYKCLRKKYVKHTIFNYESDRGYYKLVKSLKHIKERLTQKDVILIKGRRQKALQKERLRKKNSLKLQDDKCYNKQKIINFIKQSLKTKEEIDYNSVAKISHSKQDELDELNNKIQQSFYPSFSLNKTVSKIVISKDSPSNKYSISLKQKLSLNNFKINRGDEIKRKKYIQSVQKTYYKFKPNNEKKQQNKASKSQRSSYKFSRLPIEDNRTAVIRLRNQKQQIQHMKFKIEKFKQCAMKDLQIIEQCKPSKLHRQFRKQHRVFDDKLNINLESNDRNSKVFSQKIILTEKFGNQKHYPTNLTSQKQEMWHEMYNIRDQPIVSTCKTTKQMPKIVYKLAKQSDKLRKDKHKFIEHCRGRAEILEQDLDLADRMRMGIR